MNEYEARMADIWREHCWKQLAKVLASPLTTNSCLVDWRNCEKEAARLLAAPWSPSSSNMNPGTSESPGGHTEAARGPSEALQPVPNCRCDENRGQVCARCWQEAMTGTSGTKIGCPA